MERLTQWIDKDRAIPATIGLRRCGYERLVTQLAKYEDTGLEPEQIIEIDELYSEIAKENIRMRKRDTAMLLENIKCAKKDKGYLSFGTCPKCKRRVSNVEGGNYCQNCGQRLKWEE